MHQKFLKLTVVTGLTVLPMLAPAAFLEPASLFVEGYAGQTSYAPGDELELHVSTSAPTYAIEISRLGGQVTVVTNQGGLPGKQHPIPQIAATDGCRWPVSVKFAIPAGWASGYYRVVLRAADGGGSFVHRNRRTAQGECFFIVRPAQPGSRTRILLQLSSNTYNAYNSWGGFSLYAYNGLSGVQGHRVSFQRPPASQYENWERPFVEWAENNGYVLDFCSNLDLEFMPELLRHYRLVLSVGHDEYWSAGMRDQLEAFIGGGGNVAFFSGNTCCWQVRPEDNGRALTCWKQMLQYDPVYATTNHALLSTLWSHHLVQRPENQLTGVGFLHGGYHRSHGQLMDGKGSYSVFRPDHWILEHTGLKRGDEFGAKDTIVGYECDGCDIALHEGLPVPTGRDGTPTNFVILATAPAKWAPDDSWWYERFDRKRLGVAVLGTYTRGGTVFTTGSTDWSHGLRGQDPVVQRITRNVLDRLSR